MLVAGPTSPFAGQNIRESRDNPDHPNSTPIAVLFDVTGSMQNVPRVLQEKLAGLFALLLRKGYAEDPQVMVGAYGDANVDRVPLQASQFESDNRIDDALDALYLEGGGGGNNGETASAAWYFLTHTATDAWDKRGRKGYAFTIGDERTYGLTKDQVHRLTGDTVQADLTPEQIVAMVSEKWELFHLVVDNYTAKSQRSAQQYQSLLGDRCIVLEDPANAAETIAGIIGVLEGTVDLDGLRDDLVEIGAGDASGAVGKSLARVAGRSGGRGGVAVADTPTGLIGTGRSGADRL